MKHKPSLLHSRSSGRSFLQKAAKNIFVSSLLGAWARGAGGSGDTGFEVGDFRTSAFFPVISDYLQRF